MPNKNNIYLKSDSVLTFSLEKYFINIFKYPNNYQSSSVYQHKKHKRLNKIDSSDKQSRFNNTVDNYHLRLYNINNNFTVKPS